jgi:hypothetical protein
LRYLSRTYGALDLDSRAIDAWPDFGDWPVAVELLEATILSEGPYPRAEQHLTNDALTCISALANSRIYVLAAKEQMGRFEAGLAEMERLKAPEHARTMNQAFADLHLYFVCWSHVRMMLALVSTRSGFGIAVPQQDRAKLDRYKQARDHLEHFDERLPGGNPRPRHLSTVPIYDRVSSGSLSRNGDARSWEFFGDSWDVSAGTVNELHSIAFDFETGILRAAIQTFDSNPSSSPHSY